MVKTSGRVNILLILLLVAAITGLMTLIVHPLPMPTFNPISSSGTDPLSDIDKVMFPELDDFISDLSMVELPDEIEDLYNPKIIETDWDLIGIKDVREWAEEDSSGLIVGLFYPDLARALDNLSDELQKALKDKPQITKVPDSVIRAEMLRIFIKQYLIEIARRLDQIREILKSQPGYIQEEVNKEISKRINSVLSEIGFLFDGNQEVLNLVKSLLNGEITTEQFDVQWHNILPEITWEWEY